MKMNEATQSQCADLEAEVEQFFMAQSTQPHKVLGPNSDEDTNHTP